MSVLLPVPFFAPHGEHFPSRQLQIQAPQRLQAREGLEDVGAFPTATARPARAGQKARRADPVGVEKTSCLPACSKCCVCHKCETTLRQQDHTIESIGDGTIEQVVHDQGGAIGTHGGAQRRGGPGG